ncbi:TIGR04222 domain-containing membrane protein [Streptacidiphilus rugosus]|uniref:TIGR04222 domain-containing membrane protein n=1 Tax=Streptacidiphilus rugosus TaxID=405783 RepID=UPI001E5DBFD7|nr:TIGR04222 domain-containing membrane protein [Streptacidiphilus rugosus]
MFLVPACLLAIVSSVRLCRLVAANDPMPTGGSTPTPSAEADLVDAAYLAGGPERVVDLVLVEMARAGLLHLAHTGWTSVARPEPRSELETAVLTAIGPEGQCRTDDLRREVARGPAVRAVADRLALAGLAVPAGARAALAHAVAGVRWSLLATVALFGAAVGGAGARMLLGGPAAAGAVGELPKLAAWFALPLILGAGTLVMARIEIYPVTPWAAPPGQTLLRALRPRRGDAARQDPTLVVVLRGAGGVKDPSLRAALRARRGR